MPKSFLKYRLSAGGHLCINIFKNKPCCNAEVVLRAQRVATFCCYIGLIGVNTNSCWTHQCPWRRPERCGHCFPQYASLCWTDKRALLKRLVSIVWAELFWAHITWPTEKLCLCVLETEDRSLSPGSRASHVLMSTLWRLPGLRGGQQKPGKTGRTEEERLVIYNTRLCCNALVGQPLLPT